jgi:predicted NAD/FAD-binding protein
LVGTVWSAGAGASLDYPARYLFQFLDNHGLLTVRRTHRWHHVVGGSRSYVDRVRSLLDQSGATIRQGVPVRAVRRHPDGVTVVDDADRSYAMDSVILATHADEALNLLVDPTPGESDLLRAFTYTRSEVTLHTDIAVLPSRRRIQAAWNQSQNRCSGDQRAVVSYHVNRLMALSEPLDHVVTLNGRAEVDESKVVSSTTYDHPLHTRASVAARARLRDLADDRTAFAGSYHGWGFHEDACWSGVRAARAFGAEW